MRTYILERSSDFVIGTSKHFLQTWFIHRGCLIIIWTGLNIKIGIPQKVYEWPSCYFAKIFLQSQLGIILAKGQLDHSHIYFLNYANFIFSPVQIIMGHPLITLYITQNLNAYFSSFGLNILKQDYLKKKMSLYAMDTFKCFVLNALCSKAKQLRVV